MRTTSCSNELHSNLFLAWFPGLATCRGRCVPSAFLSFICLPDSLSILFVHNRRARFITPDGCSETPLKQRRARFIAATADLSASLLPSSPPSTSNVTHKTPLIPQLNTLPILIHTHSPIVFIDQHRHMPPHIRILIDQHLHRHRR